MATSKQPVGRVCTLIENGLQAQFCIIKIFFFSIRDSDVYMYLVTAITGKIPLFRYLTIDQNVYVLVVHTAVHLSVTLLDLVH